MNKEQTAHLVGLEERTKALAEEVQALEFEVKDRDKRIAELDDATHTARWLMCYVMELHDFHENLFKHFKTNDFNGLKDEIIMQFPMLQGMKNQRDFKESGIENPDSNKVRSFIERVRKIILEATDA